MKRVIATVGALTFLSVGAANAAVASYDFENATVGSVSVASFGSALTNLGVTTSTISGASGTQGVYVNNLTNGGITGANSGATPNGILDFKSKSFAVGNNGTWTLSFGNNGTFGNVSGTSRITSFDFAYNETESSGFVVTYFDLLGVQIGSAVTVTPSGNAGSQCQFVTTCSTVLSGTIAGGIGSVSIQDLGDDNVGIDNITVTTTALGGGGGGGGGAVPEPSTYAMIGTALAGMAFFRRRR